MTRINIAVAVFLGLPCAAQDYGRGPVEAHYEVRAERVEAVEGEIPLWVRLRISDPPGTRLVFEIPVWTPGSYRLRDFPDRIHEVAARGPDGPIDVMRLNRQAYELRLPPAGDVEFTYRVDLRDNDRFMMRGPKRRCLTYEGPQVYMYARGLKSVPCHVDFALPEGWEVGSGLTLDPDGSGYFADNYDFLADCPVKLGAFQKWTFESHGTPIDVVLDGPADLELDDAAWLANIQKITDVQGDLFGGFPFARYTFLFTAAPRGVGGGLEHLTSTAIGLSAASLARSPRTGMGVTAHEFFHLWNVKRLRPRALGPFDYTRPNRTTGLWLMEGVTSYYTEVTLARCGLRSADTFWRSMARSISGLESAPGRHHTSSAMASFSVWDAKPRDRAVNYYTSGSVLGLLLDLEIRSRTDNRRSLDDFMRALYAVCRDRGHGYDDEDLVSIASTTAGADLSEWFDRYVTGTVVPDYATALGHAGMTYSGEETTRRGLRGLRTGAAGGAPIYADPDARGVEAVLRASGRVVELDGEPVADRDELVERLADR
ncbi:MAG: hypothetical protein AAF628_36130, partial [Planctomycetota bacterium]